MNQRSWEVLEARIAPAVVIGASGKTATFTDVDGDLVTITVSKGQLAMSDFSLMALGMGEQLQALNFSDDMGEFGGANVSILAQPQNGKGDGFVNVGAIESTGFPLGRVVVDGDLGRVCAGGDPVALAGLTARSLGKLGTVTGAPDLVSAIDGNAGSVMIAGDILNAWVQISGSLAGAKIGGSIIGEVSFGGLLSVGEHAGSITVGGSIRGDAPTSGGIVVDEAMNSLTVKGSILGGPGDVSGFIETHRGKTLTIRGDIRGGSGLSSGSIMAGFDRVAIGGSLIGGNGEDSGRARLGLAKSILIRGSLLGGDGVTSGTLQLVESQPALSIGGSIVGADGANSGALTAASNVNVLSLKLRGGVYGGDGMLSGVVDFDGRAGTLAIGASIVGGEGTNSGNLVVAGNIASLLVGGSIVGGRSGGGEAGSANGNIGLLSVLGSVVGGPRGGGIIFAKTLGKGFIADSIIGGDLPSSANSDVLINGAVVAERILSLTVGGSLRAGTDFDSNNDVERSGLIQAAFGIGTLTIKGDVRGSSTDRATIEAGAPLPGSRSSQMVIGKLVIGGNVHSADILAGYFDGNVIFGAGDVSVGPISVGRDWIASNLAVGVEAGVDMRFGTPDDALYSVGNTALPARIASLEIRGQAEGSPQGMDHFGIVAQMIGSVTIGGLKKDVSSPLNLGTQMDFIARTDV